jgi:hypothetical protein
VSRRDNGIEAILISRQFPVFSKSWHHEEAQIMGVSPEGLCVQGFGPLARKIEKLIMDILWVDASRIQIIWESYTSF